MNQSLDCPSEARLLTERLRNSVEPSERFERQKTISERDGHLQMVVEGAVVRQRMLADGRCQTVAVYQRDDVINLSRFVRKQPSTDNLIALRGTKLSSIEPEVVQELRQMSASGVDGMAALVLRELSISQERVTCIGQRSATESMAHFMCETIVRCCGPRASARRDNCSLAMTQDMLGQTLGISSVHVNRTLQAIRALELADIVDFELTVRDFDGLAELGEFDDAYLAPV